MNLRTKLLRGGDDTTVLLVYPSTVEEYRQSLAALGGAPPSAEAGGGYPPAERKTGHASYLVTTTRQRQLWRLLDLAATAGVAVVDERWAMRLLHDAAAGPDEPPVAFLPGGVDRVSSAASRASALAAARDLLAPGVVTAASGSGDRGRAAEPRPRLQFTRRTLLRLRSAFI